MYPRQSKQSRVNFLFFRLLATLRQLYILSLVSNNIYVKMVFRGFVVLDDQIGDS